MAKFLFNGPCPKCGSRDNLANYSDGSKWCWGCRYYQSPNISPYVTENLNVVEKDKVSTIDPRIFSKELSEDTYTWLGKYNVPLETALNCGVRSIHSRSQTAFLFRGHDLADPGHDPEDKRGICDERAIIGYQARNHNPNSKQRYYTSGKVEELLPIYFHTEGYTKTLVLVEDCLSAIKTSTITDAMPILGSDLSNKKLSRLRPFYGHLKVWLDSDMLHKARTIKNRAEAIGITAEVIYTPKDPKEYSYAEIREYLGQEVL